VIVEPIVLREETVCPLCLTAMTATVGRNLASGRSMIWWRCTQDGRHRSCFTPLPIDMESAGPGIIPGVRRDDRDGLQSRSLAGSPAHTLPR